MNPEEKERNKPVRPSQISFIYTVIQSKATWGLIPVYLCVAVRSRSLLFYDEEAPLEESLVPSEGERLQSEIQSYTQTRRHTADTHSNQTNGPKLEQRYKQLLNAAEICIGNVSGFNLLPFFCSSPQSNQSRQSLRDFIISSYSPTEDLHPPVLTSENQPTYQHPSSSR